MGPAAPLKRGPPPIILPPFFPGEKRAGRASTTNRSPLQPPQPSLRVRTQLHHKVAAPPPVRAREGALTLAAADQHPEQVQQSEHHRLAGEGPRSAAGGGGREVSDERDAAPFIHRPGLRWRLSCLRSFPPLPAYARAPAEGSCPRRDEDPPFQLSLCCWRLSAIRLKTEEEDKLLLTRYLHPTLRFQGFGAVEPPRSPPPPPTSTFSPNLHVFCFLNQFFF